MLFEPNHLMNVLQLVVIRYWIDRAYFLNNHFYDNVCNDSQFKDKVTKFLGKEAQSLSFLLDFFMD